MSYSSADEIVKQLVRIIREAFDRSIAALKEAGAIDTARLEKDYAGSGSKFYDLVTRQIELTAQYAVIDDPSADEIADRLVGIIGDGYSRSMAALRKTGALNTEHLDEHYKGVGSKFYDLVTEQIELTAQSTGQSIRQLSH